MRHIFLLLIVPGFLVAQQPNENWTTPVADIDFGDKRIIYSFFSPVVISLERIKPDNYNIKLLDVREVENFYGVYIDDYNELISQLIEYASDWQIGKANTRDKHIFLETCAVLIIWNIDKNEFIKINTLKTLNILKDDLSIEISKNTKMVLNLYNFYYEN